MLEISRDLLLSTNDNSLRLIEPNLHQKLISHYLCRDEITGALVIKSVAIGKKGGKLDLICFFIIKILATLNNFITEKLCDEKKFKKSNFNFTPMTQLMNYASLSIDPLPKPLLSKNINNFTTVLFTHQERYKILYKTLKENIAKFTNYFPTSLYESFIFNFVEVFLIHFKFILKFLQKFEPIFSILQKNLINPIEFEECKKSIYALITMRNGSEFISLKIFDCIYLSNGKTLTVLLFFLILVILYYNIDFSR